MVDPIDAPVDEVYHCAGVSSGALAPVDVVAVNFLAVRDLTDG